jgi:hypothetical protein
LGKISVKFSSFARLSGKELPPFAKCPTISAMKNYHRATVLKVKRKNKKKLK